MKNGSRLAPSWLTNLWNVARFSGRFLWRVSIPQTEPLALSPADRWITGPDACLDRSLHRAVAEIRLRDGKERGGTVLLARSWRTITWKWSKNVCTTISRLTARASCSIILAGHDEAAGTNLAPRYGADLPGSVCRADGAKSIHRATWPEVDERWRTRSDKTG